VVRPLVGLPQPSLEIALSLTARPDEFREGSVLVAYAMASTRDQNPGLSSMFSKRPAAEKAFDAQHNRPEFKTTPLLKMLHAKPFPPLDTG
jgi:hypothetical protein